MLRSWRYIPAVLATLVMIVLSAIPVELPNDMVIQVMLVLHPLYFWTIVRPSLFPFWLAFISGFVIDITSDSILGVSAFLQVLTALVILKQRRFLYGQPFPSLLAGFMAVSVLFELARWVIMSLAERHMFPIFPAFVSGVVSVALFPVTNALLIVAHKLITRPVR